MFTFYSELAEKLTYYVKCLTSILYIQYSKKLNWCDNILPYVVLKIAG